MQPAAPLRAHFQCVWTQVIPKGHAAPMAVLPDGCVDILWAADRLSVAGPDLTVAHVALAPGTAITGLRFQPGAAAQWLGVAMSEIAGSQLDLEDLWHERARDLAGRIGEARHGQEALLRLEAGLVRMAPAIDPPADEMAMIFRFLGREGGDAGSRIRHLRDRLGISERSLRRRCHAAFGYGPKTLDRILRLQRFLALARQGPGTGLAALAAAAGYADQAHLSREVRALAGLSPRMIIRQFADTASGNAGSMTWSPTGPKAGWAKAPGLVPTTLNPDRL